MLLHFLTAAPADGAAPGAAGGLASFLPLIALVVVFYFIIYRPQKKQEKEVAAMRNSLMVGDEVTTTGGIVGRVVTVRDDTFVIETGADRIKLKFRRSALYSIDKKADGERPKPESFKVESVKKTKKIVEAVDSANPEK